MSASACTADRELLREVLEWDVASWRFALMLWDRCAGDVRGAHLLDIGARHGGLSLWFARRGCRVVCSDVGPPSEKAIERHRRYGVAERIAYAAADAASLPFADAVFDLVCFKSVLGIVGTGDCYERQARAVREMHRVLRPGGRLLFAENLKASALHQLLRRRFVEWASRWRYVSIDEVGALFAPFSRVETACSGCLATFGRTERQRAILHGLDAVLNPVLPRRWKYIVAGCAVK